jgi:peroxiredoxin
VSEPLVPSTGWGVSHLFLKAGRRTDAQAVIAAVKGGQDGDHQAVCFSLLGHKADLGVMLLGPDLVRLRQIQSSLQAAGLRVVDSYVSLTEISEYAQGMPTEHLQARLYPRLPPEGKRAICFYPMTKRRAVGQNWYQLEYEERKRLMMEHGISGRRFHGRVLQVITGSTGLDDYEWGVTLFGVHPDDLKEVVYTMRYDEASALYAEFGRFYTGVVDEIDQVLAQVGLS